MLWYLRYLPSRGYSRFRRYQDYIRKYGRQLIAQTQVDTKGMGKDVMSVLMRANEAEDVQLRLSELEVVDQISYVTRKTILGSMLTVLAQDHPSRRS